MLSRYHEDDSGAVAVIVAIFLVAAIALSAIVIDVGYLYDTRRQLQAAAEAGALAGCQELIATNDAGSAQAAAEAYAALNALYGPVDALEIEQVDIDMAEGSVRVVVAQQAPAFFSRMFGPAANTVRAAAKAQKWQLTGGRYLVPWGVPVIRVVDRVEATVLSGNSEISTTNLGSMGGLTWSGSVPAPSAPGAYDVVIRVWNSHNIAEKVIDDNNKEMPAGRIIVPEAGSPIASISLSSDFIEAGVGPWPTLTVQTAASEPKVTLEIDGKKRNMSGSGTSWSYQFTATDVDQSEDFIRTYELNVYTGNKADTTIDAYLHVRRSTHPIAGVSISPIVAAPGGSVGVTVILNDFYPVDVQPGQEYALRVAPQSQLTGNFGELNFNKIIHSADDPPDLVTPDPGNNYYPWTAYGYEGGIHIGDIIEMSPGGSGVNTKKALDERASRLQPGEDLVVAVPIVEKYEDKGGAYDVIVVDFAAFKITYYDKEGEVRGEFLEYIANPSSYAGNPGGTGNVLYSARLVNP